MTQDITPKAVERIAKDCERAIKAMQDTFPTGQSIYTDAAATLRAQAERIDALEKVLELALQEHDEMVYACDQTFAPKARAALSGEEAP